MTAAIAVMVLLAAAPTFSGVAKQAEAAREAGRLDEAAALYRKALALRPGWRDGQWHLASILYQRDRYAEARDILIKLVRQQPAAPQPWAILGLCEFHTGEYDPAAAHLARALKIGLAATPQMQHVARYHLVLLLNRLGRHEEAWPVLLLLAQDGSDRPELIQAAGLTGLRMTVLPAEIPAEKRGLVLASGRAMWLVAQRRSAEARTAFEQLLREHDSSPGVHYMVGAVLLVSEPDAGIREMHRELELSPEHGPALLSIAFEYLKRKEPEEALKWAERAVAAAPQDFGARTALGRALVDAGQPERGAKELQAAAALAPDVPQVRFALASAYRRLGRKQDAEREQAEFLRLRNQQQP
jgi:tetratricopeptide (TPR) repeat protein